jgi:hypothetical protein
VSQTGVVVPVGVAVAGEFTPDHRPVASNPPADLSTGQAGITAPHDLNTFTEAEPMPPTAWGQQITWMSQTTSSRTSNECHRSSVTPPRHASLMRHANGPSSVLHRRTGTHSIDELTPHTPTKRPSTGHRNLPNHWMLQ